MADKIVAVRQPIFYGFHRPCLATWTLYKYIALIDIAKNHTAVDATPRQYTILTWAVEQRVVPSFDFTNEHPLAAKRKNRKLLPITNF